jgi:hypothetical protein
MWSLGKCIFRRVFSYASSAFCIQSASSNFLAVLLRRRIQHPRVSPLRNIFLSFRVFSQLSVVMCMSDRRRGLY